MARYVAMGALLAGAANAQGPGDGPYPYNGPVNMKIKHFECEHNGDGNYNMHVVASGAVPGHPVSLATAKELGQDIYFAGAGFSDCPYNTVSGLRLNADAEYYIRKADDAGEVKFKYPVSECDENGNFYGVVYSNVVPDAQCAFSEIVNLAPLHGIEFVLKVSGPQADPAEFDEDKFAKFVVNTMVDGNNGGYKNNLDMVVVFATPGYCPVTQFYVVNGQEPPCSTPEQGTFYIKTHIATIANYPQEGDSDKQFDHAHKFIADIKNNFKADGHIKDISDTDTLRAVGKAFYGKATTQLIDMNLWRMTQ